MIKSNIDIRLRNPIRSALATGTNAGATATNSAVSGKKHYFQMAAGYTDAASDISIKDGSTVIYKIHLTAAGSFEIAPPALLVGSTNTAMSVVIGSSTASCWVNLVTEAY